MQKRFPAICAALIALGVLGFPAVSAASVLTESGTKLAIGAKITATNDGVAKFVSGGVTSECKAFWTTSTLVTNDNTAGIKSTVENGAASGCTSGLGPLHLTFPGATNEGGTKHMCIQTFAGEDQGSIEGRGCGEEGTGEMTIVAKFTTIFGSVICKYKRVLAISGSFSTNSAPATLSLLGEPEFTLEEGGGTCPTSVKIVQLAFNLYTDNAEETPLSISK